MPRLVRRVLLAIAATYAVYLVAGNVLLALHLPPKWINAAQSNARLEYRWAFSLWPGHLWARDVSFTSKDSAIELSVTAAHASTWVNIPALLAMTVRLGGSTEGVSVRVRRSRAVPDLCSREAEHVPTIAGLAAPLWAWKGNAGACLAQMETTMRKSGERTDENSLWRVDIADIETRDLRELWYEAFRVAGDMRGDVSFYLWPTQRLRIDPARLEVRTATVGLGPDLVDGIAFGGALDLSVREVQFGDDDIGDILRAATATVALDADLERLDLFDSPALDLGDASGHLSVRAWLSEGVVVEGSKALLADARLSASAEAHRIVLAGGARADVKDARLELRGDIVTFSVTPAGENRPAITGKDAIITARGAARPTVFAPLPRPAIDVQLPVIEVPDVVVLNDSLGATGRFQLRSGAATARASLSMRDERLERGQLHLSSTNIVARYADLMLEGRVQLDVPARDIEGKIDLAGTTLAIRDGRVRRPAKGTTKDAGWWGGFTLTRAKIEPKKKRIEAHTAGRVATIRPLLAVFGAQGNLPGFVRNFDPGESDISFDLTASREGLGIENLAVDADSFHARANYYVHDGTTDGGLLVSLGPLTAGVEIDDGKTNVNVLGATSTFDKNATQRRQLLD